MRSFFATAILFTTLSLQAHAAVRVRITSDGMIPVVEVQTFNESCSGQANGSAYIKSAFDEWNMSVYHNASLFSAFHVTGRDTFISHLPAGCYTFIYRMADGSADTLHKFVSGPTEVVSAYKVDYLGLPEERLVSFTNFSTGAGFFDWNFGDGEHSGEISPVHTYAQPGTYTVTLTAYNRSGCSSSSSYVVNVAPANATGINEGPAQNTEKIQVESNNGSARIANTGAGTIKSIDIYSSLGQLIFSGSGNSNEFSYTAPGIYTARIVYADGAQESKNVPLN